ncbi:hypothetical protein JTE90_011857 [Oedothorax gibbosus]|uniref:Uncharacterized protein n=1 Tax=Oedothorax gibbosus TaxID=931172 RepID=A0AAV6V5L6_9ARAC|nr:hypothetical protein JTE90_011857 [Oedothorax gibbosus]
MILSDIAGLPPLRSFCSCIAVLSLAVFKVKLQFGFSPVLFGNYNELHQCLLFQTFRLRNSIELYTRY